MEGYWLVGAGRGYGIALRPGKCYGVLDGGSLVSYVRDYGWLWGNRAALRNVGCVDGHLWLTDTEPFDVAGKAFCGGAVSLVKVYGGHLLSLCGREFWFWLRGDSLWLGDMMVFGGDSLGYCRFPMLEYCVAGVYRLVVVSGQSVGVLFLDSDSGDVVGQKGTMLSPAVSGKWSKVLGWLAKRELLGVRG